MCKKWSCSTINEKVFMKKLQNDRIKVANLPNDSENMKCAKRKQTFLDNFTAIRSDFQKVTWKIHMNRVLVWEQEWLILGKFKREQNVFRKGKTQPWAGTKLATAQTPAKISKKLSLLTLFLHNLLLSDQNERPEDGLSGTAYSHDSGFEGETHYPTLPASPTTIPRLRLGSTSRRDRPRRQRTTSTSQNTIRPNEAIIRVSNNRTIYTAGNLRTFICWKTHNKQILTTFRATAMVQHNGPTSRAIRDRYLWRKCKWKNDSRSKDHRVSWCSLGDVVVHGLLL